MLEYKRQTDQVHTITLESKIVRAIWKDKEGSIGQKVYFEVWTHFVGNSSKIAVKVQDDAGKIVKTVKGNVYDDYFSSAIVIPKNAKMNLQFTAKLSAHGLEKMSGMLKVLPPRFIENARWDREEVRRGDTVKLTADTKGFPDGAEIVISIYEHDQDDAHDFITKFPTRVQADKVEVEWRYEYFEDTDDIPTEEEMQKYGKHYNPPDYFFIASCGSIKSKSGILS